MIIKKLSTVEYGSISTDADDVIDDVTVLVFFKLAAVILRMEGWHFDFGSTICEEEMGCDVLMENGRGLLNKFKNLIFFVDSTDHKDINFIFAWYHGYQIQYYILKSDHIGSNNIK